MSGADIEEIDNWLTGHKSVAGFLGEWGDQSYRAIQARCGVADINGVESAELCLTVSRNGVRQSIACIYRDKLIYHLDIVPDSEFKENHHTAAERGLPPFVYGTHAHLWDDNRAYIASAGFGCGMPLRRPLDDKPADLRDAIHLAAQHLNIQIRDKGISPCRIMRYTSAWGDTMECAEIIKFLDARRHCEPSPYGTKIATQCLYPGSSVVFVHIGTWGDEFRVSDGGEAALHALHLGRDKWAVDVGLKAAKDRFSLSMEHGELFAIARDATWLPNVVAAVANGAAFAASSATDHALHKQQRTLKDQIGERLHEVFADQFIARDFDYRGRSGKLWQVDYAITAPEPILIKAVTPHHNSIAATYTALSDIKRDENRRFSVYSRRPDQDDSALLRQVAELVPLTGLSPALSKLAGLGRLHH